ncbi:protein PTHB1 isoform X2 [Tetranychus urticae]|uniref:protein PTHB1 isoform X2 n=1 Tax=Tetranychus urticae TaxID=32264 RepID=UPI00077BA979|nr:protein PTHB1 isoform X2 [Tetranychus urticae]
MSLFRARDWWTTNAGSDENFGPTCLCISNIDNSRDNSDKIITGSHEGILRIYSTANTLDDKRLKPFQANDLLLEVDLRQPILQLASGLLLSASKSLHLAVLHPRKISIYSAAATIGVTEYGSSYNVLLIYEHNLPQSAYNFTIGPFGQIKGRDFLCVQSIDGTLSFYEQESFAFSRHLTNFMLPGPIVYLPTTDSFVVANGAWFIESFRYQVLAISKANDIKLPDPDSNQRVVSSSGRRVTPDWSLQIGEPLIDLQAHTLSKKFSLIVALGERNLYIIRDSGIVSWMKKLNFTPYSLTSYLNQASDNIIILISSENGNLLIYSGNKLQWSCQLPFAPIALARASFPNIHGSLVTLSASGELAASYLGTSPSVTLSTPRQDEQGTSSHLTYAETEAELTELRKVIASFNSNPASGSMGGNFGAIGSLSVKGSTNDDNCDIKVTLGNLVTSLVRSSTGPAIDDLLPMVALTISLTCINAVSNVRVSIEAGLPIAFEPSLLNYPSILAGNETQVTTLTATLSNLILPINLSASILITYTNASGSPRVYRKPFYLPLSLICRLQSTLSSPSSALPLSPTSSSPSSYRDSMSHNVDIAFAVQMPVDLRIMFNDLVSVSSNPRQASPASPIPTSLSIPTNESNIDSNNMSISFYTEPASHVTISGGIKMKGSLNKIKFRSNNLHGISIVINEFISRCKSSRINLEAISYDRSSLPFDLYLNCLDKRFNLRIKIINLSKNLATQTSYFRAVQKRLLIKFKDRNPTPLSNLDILLDEIYSKTLLMDCLKHFVTLELVNTL